MLEHLLGVVAQIMRQMTVNIRPSQTAAFPTFVACAKLIHLVILQSLGDTILSSKEP